MYECALQRAACETLEDLGTVAHISQRDYDERVTFSFRAQVPALEYISLLIENALLLKTHRGGRAYAGFQKLSRMEYVAERYLRLADLSERVYIFGEDDWKPPRHPNMRVVKLSSSLTLAREWFVIAESPMLSCALVGTDEDGFDAPVLDARYFRAFKTHDPKIVAHLAAAAEDIIDRTLNI